MAMTPLLLLFTTLILNRSSFIAMVSSLSLPQTQYTEVNWGIIGLGDVVDTKSGPPFWKCKNSKLVAVYRRTPGKAKEWAAERVPKEMNCVGYDNLLEFLDASCDAIYICTPPGSHLGLCEEIVNHAKKNKKSLPAVYIEKPVGRCAAETIQMVDMFKKEENDKHLFYTAYMSRAYTRTQAIRKLLLKENNDLGSRITSISYKFKGNGGIRGLTGSSIPWRLIPEYAGGGLVLDIGVHLLDRIDYLCGPIINISGEKALKKNIGSPANVEDFVEFNAEIGTRLDDKNKYIDATGASAHFMWDFSLADNEEIDLLIVKFDSQKSLQLAGMSPSGTVRIVDSDDKTVLEEIEFEMPEHVGQNMIQAITNDILSSKNKNLPENKGYDNTVDYLSYGDNAIRVQRILDTVLVNFYGSREIGFWIE